EWLWVCRPASESFSLRRQSCARKLAYGGVSEGYVGTDPENGARVSAARESHHSSCSIASPSDCRSGGGCAEELVQELDTMKTTRIRDLASMLLVVASAVASPALAQKQTPPKGGPPKPFAVPADQAYALANGMRVTLIPYGNVPKVSLELAIEVGTINEPDDLSGIADLTTQLLKEGTSTLNSSALAEATARMGSSLGVGAGADDSSLSLDVLSEFAPDAAKLLAD